MRAGEAWLLHSLRSLLVGFVLVLSASTLGAGIARAQTGAPPGGGTASSQGGAPAGGGAASPPQTAQTAGQPQPAQPTSQTADRARARFMEGMRLAQTGNCAGAIAEFQASYALLPRPNTLYNIAQCQERTFRYDLAIAAYQRYLREAAPDAEDRAAVQAAMSTLHNLLGTIHVSSNASAEVWMDNHLVGHAPGDVLVPGGQHTIELRSGRYLPARKEVQVAARESASVSFTLRRAERRVTIREQAGFHPWLFWTGVAATAVAAGVGGYFGLHALSLSSDAHTAHDSEPRLSYQSQIDQIDGAALVADILYASAGVLAVGTTIVFFLTNWGNPPPQVSEEPEHTGRPRPPAQALRLVPIVGPTAFGLSLAGDL